MTSSEIIDFLREDLPYLKKEFGVISIGLFGSYAKWTHGPSSDVDLLVELKEPPFDFLAGLLLYLEDKIGKPIELIRKRPSLSQRFLNRIETHINYA
jgi:hypothetical protein